MLKLNKIGFSSKTYSEIILSISYRNEINAAPMGVLLHNDKLKLKIYPHTRTYRLILDGADDCVLNITSNPKLFYYSIFMKDKIKYVRSRKTRSPRVRGCDGYIECKMSSVIRQREHLDISLKPILIDVKPRNVATFNRAGPAIIEALVHYTKIPFLNNKEIRYKILYIKFLRDTVYKSTRDAELRKIISDIVGRCEDIQYGNFSPHF